MALAGITAGSAVVFTGYSQGGLIAARLAASGDYHTTGLYTLGGPAGQVPVPAASLRRRGAQRRHRPGHRRHVRLVASGAGAPYALRRTSAEHAAGVPRAQLGRYRPARACSIVSDDPRVDRRAGRHERTRGGRRHRQVDVLPGHRGYSARLAVAPADDRAQQDADEPADEAQHHRAEDAPPEVVHVQAEAEQRPKSS